MTPSPNTPDPPPPYTKTLSHPSPLSLGDHLAPPPSYSRARELSESDDTFLPLEMMNMEKIQEMDLEDLDEEEDTSDNNIEIPHCTISSNLRCANCLHRLHIWDRRFNLETWLFWCKCSFIICPCQIDTWNKIFQIGLAYCWLHLCRLFWFLKSASFLNLSLFLGPSLFLRLPQIGLSLFLELLSVFWSLFSRF